MDRRQKRARRLRRKQHQRATAQGTRRVFFDHAGQEIPHATALRMEDKDLKDLNFADKPRGPKPNPHSYHKSDSHKHDDRLDSRGKALKDLHAIGLDDLDARTIREYQRLVRSLGSRAAAKEELSKHLKKMMGLKLKKNRPKGPAEQITKLPSPTDGVYGHEVFEIGYDESSPADLPLDPVANEHMSIDHGDETYVNRVPEAEWEDLAATAKKRRRGDKGYIKVLEGAGYELLSDDHNPRERESWIKKEAV